MRTRADTLLLATTAIFVGGLAIVAGAISFAHMRELATLHSQFGWKAFAFPISVDGLEVVASLYLVAQRRAGRPTGWIPWIALVVGTLASLAANVAVGGADAIGKALAGWPALSMLVSVKLLFAMLDHENVDHGRDRRTVRDDQWTSPTVPDVLGTVRRTGPDDVRPSRIGGLSSGTESAGPSVRSARSATGDASGGAGVHVTSMDIDSVAHLIPAARAARVALTGARRSLSRDALAEAMRDDGYGVSNARASLLLQVLKAEHVPTTVPAIREETPNKPTTLAEAAA